SACAAQTIAKAATVATRFAVPIIVIVSLVLVLVCSGAAGVMNHAYAVPGRPIFSRSLPDNDFSGTAPQGKQRMTNFSTVLFTACYERRGWSAHLSPSGLWTYTM
ncbi:MAG: hypothetical protein OEM00_12545, partial [Burkholderiaceae bacterium]|nr:hypothetical protein [Burkholderiaceae bacterium]